MIPENQCISGIDTWGYLFVYSKTKCFDAKKSLYSANTSPLEPNVS